MEKKRGEKMKLKDIIVDSEYDFFVKDYQGQFANPKEDLLKLNPKQIIFNDIQLDYWKITYNYTTKRGNKKKNIKYMMQSKKLNLDKDDIKDDFLKWVSNFNKENPYRALLNVKILNVFYIGNSKLLIQ